MPKAKLQVARLSSTSARVGAATASRWPAVIEILVEGASHKKELIMLRSLRELKGYRVAASDGDIGRIADLYFDDDHWAIRYLVIDAGDWLRRRQVLISPFSVSSTDWAQQQVELRLTRDQVMRSPSTDTAQPVSRVMETQLNRHYGWPDYWGGTELWGPSQWPTLPAASGAIPAPQAQPTPPKSDEPLKPADAHLHSSTEIEGYHIQAQDGDLGRVSDLLFEDQDWSIRALVVDTTPLWVGGDVAVAPEQIDGVVWEQRAVTVKGDRESVKQNPAVDLASLRRRK